MAEKIPSPKYDYKISTYNAVITPPGCITIPEKTIHRILLRIIEFNYFFKTKRTVR